jgi:dihydropteroate synthase
MTQLLGILNITPDSCSEDGMYGDPAAALHRIDLMIEQGAAVIDIGAESTRPGAIAITPEEEWQRLAPVLELLGPRFAKAQFSLDTRHPETALRALALGFHWINDVTGGRNPKMIECMARSDCRYVIMHALSVPVNPKETLASTEDPVEMIIKWANDTIERLENAGIARSRIILDPGIGFGKTAEQSFTLIKNIGQLKDLGVPLLVGHSRKSFLTLFTDKPYSERDPETLIFSYYLASQGVDYLRIHDLENHVSLLKIKKAFLEQMRSPVK